MDSVIGSARVLTSTKQSGIPLPTLYNQKNNSNKSPIGLSYSSSSGYSTQSLSESSSQTNKTSNSSHLVSHECFSPYYSQSSSQASLNHASNLNILNPTNLCSSPSSGNGSSLSMSYMRTSTPTNPLDSTHFNSNQYRSQPSSNNKPSFNPTCNSSLLSLSKDIWAKRIEYDTDFSLKSTPPSSILSQSDREPSVHYQHHQHHQQPIQTIDYSLANQQHYQTSQRRTKITNESMSKWSNSASKLLTYVVKLFSCFNLFSIIKKTPTKKSKNNDQKRPNLVRRPTKTNHSVIELYKNANRNPSSSLNNNDDSFIDTQSNYLRFANGTNYVASTPIDLNKKPQVVTIISNPSKTSQFKAKSVTKLEEIETYDNVPSLAPSSGSLGSNNSSIDGKITMPSKYSTFLQMPSHNSPVRGLPGSVESTVSSVRPNESETSNISRQNDFHLSIIQLNRRYVPEKCTQKNIDYVNSDFIIQSDHSTEVKKCNKVINIRNKVINNRRRPIYEDVLCDKEVESYFNEDPSVDDYFLPVQIMNNGVNLNVDNRFYQQSSQPQRIIHNKGFQYSNVIIRNNISNQMNRVNVNRCNLIGSGIVRQTHGESYC